MGQSDDVVSTNLDKILPFATQMGNGVAFDGGFAATAFRENAHGTEAVFVTCDSAGRAWHVQSLGEVHGDTDPPLVISDGETLGVALLEPTGASRTLRLGLVRDSRVEWNAEITQGTDDSLAFDVAVGEQAGVAVWDEADSHNKVSRIFAAIFSPKTQKSTEKPQAITLPGTDADQPRIAVREGGFWVAWIAHRPAPAPDDGRYHAEDLSYRWLEIAQLDQQGRLCSKPRRASSPTGHVLAFDLTETPKGDALLAWRDSDMPVGSAGGTLWYASVHVGGIDAPVALDIPNVKAIGEPRMVPGWMSISNSRGTTMLGTWSGTQVDVESFQTEPALGTATPLAAHGNNLLVARPAGAAVQLYLASCAPKPRRTSPTPSAK